MGNLPMPGPNDQGQKSSARGYSVWIQDTAIVRMAGRGAWPWAIIMVNHAVIWSVRDSELREGRAAGGFSIADRGKTSAVNRKPAKAIECSPMMRCAITLMPIETVLREGSMQLAH